MFFKPDTKQNLQFFYLAKKNSQNIIQKKVEILLFNPFYNPINFAHIRFSPIYLLSSDCAPRGFWGVMGEGIGREVTNLSGTKKKV